jgi:hypothetical protein
MHQTYPETYLSIQMEERETIINNYLTGYNAFDIEKMVSDFDEQIVFENILNDKVNLSLTGLPAFKEQAEQALNYFSERKQIATSFRHTENETQADIDYRAILAMDFPNGLKKGDEMKLTGKSIFRFSGNKIIRLTDIS